MDDLEARIDELLARARALEGGSMGGDTAAMPACGRTGLGERMNLPRQART